MATSNSRDAAAKAPSRRSASGARLIGDDVQHLVALYWTLRALRPEERVVSVAVEAEDAGNVDDVVVRRISGSHTYYQVKAAVSAREPANGSWLMAASPQGGPSILKKLYTSWQTLCGGTSRADLALVTTRSIDPEDPILTLRDHHETVAGGLTLASARSAAGRARREWAEYLGVAEEELLAFLADLRFLTDGGEASWVERVQVVMQGLGLHHDEHAVWRGVAMVRAWVKDGRRELTRAEIQADVDALGLSLRAPEALLAVQALDRDPLADEATVALDWVDDFIGDEAGTRRQALTPDLWDGKFRPELREAARTIKANGYRHVVVRGAMRLPCWFAVGAEFRSVAGFTVASMRGASTWSSTVPPAECELRRQEVTLGQGQDLAVALGIAADLSDDVLAYLRAEGIPVASFVSLTPARGPSGIAVLVAAHATGFARAIRSELRTLSRERSVRQLHLFLAMPHGLALQLGHLWDRLPPTRLYADLGSGEGYTPAFLIPA
jgi:hypothetical protein